MCRLSGALMNRLSIASLLLAPLIAAPASAETVSNFTLANGMDVVVIEDHRAPVVVHMVWYRAGSADEAPGVSGVAHFLEHLMFKGTDKLKSGEFSDIVEANGGNDNAFTTWDYTGYFQRIAADRLDLMMSLEAGRMRGLVLSESDVVTERQVILEERSQRTDSDPAALFTEQRRAAQWMNHRYGVPIIGWRHEMEQLSRQDALDWYHTYYSPNNATLVVAGDVDPDDVRALAEKNYGPLAPTVDLPERIRPEEPPQLAERRITFDDPRVAQPYVIRTYMAPERDAGDQKTAAALTVLAELLGGNGATSVLGRKLQFDSQTAIYTSAFYDGVSLDDTNFGFAVVPAEGVTLQQAEDAVDGVLAQFLIDGPDPAQFARIKTQIKAEQIYGKDDVQGLARRYGEGLSSGLTLQDIKDWPWILDAVTPEDVMAAARDVLNRKTAVTGWLVQSPETEVQP
jgi:zinc protease